MRTRKILLASTAVVLCAAFENENGWKMDGDKLAVDSSGNPIYINSGGQEMSVKHDTIANLNAEAKNHRTAKEAAEATLKQFEGIDPVKARKALEDIGKIDAKQLIDAGKVDEVKAEITRQYETQLAERDNALTERDSRIKRMTVDNAFATSDYYAKNIATPRDMFEAQFGRNFDFDEKGKLIAKGPDGNPIYSKKHVGEPASFDEALEILVEQYPHKDQILRAPDQRGTGNNGSGGNRGTGRVLRRADFDNADPGQKAAYAASMAKGELTISDG